MKKIRFYTSFFLKIAIIIALLGGENIFANNHSNENFAIIWKNSDLNFNIQNQEDKAFINMTTGKISGKFYIEWLGFAQIKNFKKLWENAEILKIIFNTENTSIGNITGDLEINKKTFIVTGNIISNMGNLSLENISLNNPNTHLADLGNLQANHNSQIRINNPKENEIYELEIYFNNQKIQTATENNNIFENIDLSLAGNYDFKFITKDENNNNPRINEFKNISVKPNEMSTNLDNWNFYAKKFCQENPVKNNTCIDGNERKPSEIIIPTGKVGEDMKFEIKLRDKYWNRISGKNLDIEFEKSENIEFGIPASFNQTQGKITGSISAITNSDYSFSFIPHISAETNEITIHSLKYNNTDILSHFPAIKIEKPVEIEAEIPEKIFSNIGAEAKITTKNISKKISNPKIIVKMIGNGEFENILTDGEFECKKDIFSHNLTGLCKSANFLEKVIGYTPTNNEKSVKILPKISTSQENLKLEFWLNYNISSKNFSKKINEKSIIVEKSTPKDLEIAGGTHNVGNITENGTTFGTWRTKLLNLIRKNIAYLERNRTHFDKNYIIRRNNDISAEIWTNPTKRTYISIWHDITIDTNINPINGPIVIISLANGNNGGNIKIKWHVTNINATLIAEKSILGDDAKNNQLYIKGSVMADNMCNDKDSCFLKIRKDFDFTNPDHNKTKENNPNRIIIEYDPAIISNPPPALENFVE